MKLKRKEYHQREKMTAYRMGNNFIIPHLTEELIHKIYKELKKLDTTNQTVQFKNGVQI